MVETKRLIAGEKKKVTPQQRENTSCVGTHTISLPHTCRLASTSSFVLPSNSLFSVVVTRKGSARERARRVACQARNKTLMNYCRHHSNREKPFIFQSTRAGVINPPQRPRGSPLLATSPSPFRVRYLSLIFLGPPPPLSPLSRNLFFFPFAGYLLPLALVLLLVTRATF